MRTLVTKAREIGVTDPEFLRELDATESAAAAKSMAVVRNGVFPHWSLERYLLIGGVAATVVVNVFDVGGRAQRVETRLEQSADAIVDVQRTLDVVQADVVTIKVEQARVRTQLDLDESRAVRPRETPAFRSGARSVQ